MPGSDFVVRLVSGQITFQGLPSDFDDNLYSADEAAAHKSSKEKSLNLTEPTYTSKAVDLYEVGKLIREEARATGAVKNSVYKQYLSAAGWSTWSIILIALALERFLRKNHVAPVLYGTSF